MLRFQHRMRPRKLQVFPTGGPEARLQKLRQIITGLIRYERIEPTWAQADEARQYAERLIYLAIKNGDQHKPTMEAADYWLTEKDLIPKLFQVIVPRFQNSKSSYTNLYKQAVEYPGTGKPLGVLELKGNPWPPVRPRQRDTQHLISNVLLTAARHDFHAQRRPQEGKETVSSQSSQQQTSSSSLHQSSSLSSSEPSSSVDSPHLNDEKR